MIKNKKVLITGGAGFVGSNLVHALKSTNTVVSIDNYSSGKQEREHEGATYINLDCRNIHSISDIFDPDIIYHFGEYSRVENSLKNPSLVFDNNIEGTYQIMKYSKEKKAKLVYAGSSTKFGDDGKNKLESPYAITKSINTELVKNYCLWNKVDFAITYFYNVYGDGENEDGEFATVIGIFKNLVKQGLPLKVVKPGTQTRNFTHISDIIDGLIKVGMFGNGDEYGIGSEESFSVLDVAKLFSDKIIMIPERKGNRMNSLLNCERTKELGWKSTQCLKNYIKEYLNTL